MANAVKGAIEAKVSDGRTLTMVFDMNTWADAEDETGLKLDALLDGLKSNSLSAKQQRALFWCALKEHHPEIDLREAGRLFVELAEAMSKAMESSMPVEEAGDEAEADPPLRVVGTGTNS